MINWSVRFGSHLCLVTFLSFTPEPEHFEVPVPSFIFTLHCNYLSDFFFFPFIIVFHRPPCERHLFADFAVFNSQTLALMLKEDSDEDVTLLTLLSLPSIQQEHFVSVEPSQFNETFPV